MVAKKIVQHDQRVGQPFEGSQSMAKNWRRCKALYGYRYVQLIRRKRPIVQLIRGTMIGKCLDAIALSRLVKKAVNFSKVLESYAKEYAKLFKQEKEYYGDPVGEVIRIADRYHRIYAADGLTYVKGSHGDPFEFPVHVDIAPGIVYVGHIDKMPTDKQGRVWDMDHKSHKNIPGSEDRFRDLQQTIYQWAMPLSGYPKPAGVLWDYIRTKPPAVPETLVKGGLSQRQDMDTDYETYFGEVTRLKLNPRDYSKMAKILKPRGHMDFFQRVQLPSPSPVLVKNVVDDLRSTLIEIKAIGGTSMVRSIDYTCKGCEFFNLCQAEFRGVDSSYIRKTEYETNPDPRHIHVQEDD